MISPRFTPQKGQLSLLKAISEGGVIVTAISLSAYSVLRGPEKFAYGTVKSCRTNGWVSVIPREGELRLTDAGREALTRKTAALARA